MLSERIQNSLLVMLGCSVLWQHCWADHRMETCSSPTVSSVKFSVKSQQNQTGHWISKVHLGPEDQKQGRRWSVDVEQQTVDCNGTTTLLIDADIISSPPRLAGYELFPGLGYYKFHDTPTTWTVAKHICEEEGGHLAIVNSEEESKMLSKLFARYPKIHNAYDANVAAVGFHDQVKEGEYVTITGEPLYSLEFHRWSPNYNSPDNFRGSATHPGEDCGSIYRDGLLNDIDCNENIAFICEQEL